MFKNETAVCYYCGSDDSSFFDSENGYNLFKCSGCGLLYVSPIPDEKQISTSSKTGLHSGDDILDVTGSFKVLQVEVFKDRIRDLYGSSLNKLYGSLWLDIGCGHGEFLKALESFTNGEIKGTGCEPNEAKVKSAKSKGLNVESFNLEKHHFEYDYVSLLNVYSHLPNPVVQLEKWRRFLKIGGELLIETGDIGGLTKHTITKPYFLPDHLSFATKEIVCGILEKLGFKILDVKMYRQQTIPELSLRMFLYEIKQVLIGKNNLKSIMKYRRKNANRDMWIKAVRIK